MGNNESLSRAELWEIDEAIGMAVSYIADNLEREIKEVDFSLPWFDNLEERVKLLVNQTMNDRDYVFAKQIASYERGLFLMAGNACYKHEEKVSLINVHLYLYRLYRWLAEEYYGIPSDAVDRYYMKGNRLYDSRTGLEYAPDGQENTEETPIIHGKIEGIFQKAIKVGLMEKTGSGYRWLHNGRMKASLGYFLNRVFNPKGTAQIPLQRLEALFGVTRLDTAIGQALTAKKPQRWRKEIDVVLDD